ncbi:uncharacterized protein LOC134249849 [Saccostrea cucullata]|uniref:uncharacterized protein LOC134249849 n=1 Tax=Saccostrea cuccullata TaxID=36930 RepID=UPI002ED67B64
MNIAVGKPAAESSTAVPGSPAVVAVDGNRDTNWFSGSCTHTGFNENTPWWRVDLLNIYYIVTVRMLNRGDPPNYTANRVRSQLQRDTGFEASVQNTRNRLDRFHLQARRPRAIPCLRDRLIKDRLRWCLRHQRWYYRRWNHVMFSDESRFTLDFLDKHVSDRLRDVTITAGNTTSSLSYSGGFFAGPGSTGELVTVQCAPHTVGRYVKIQIVTEFRDPIVDFTDSKSRKDYKLSIN